MSLESWRWSEVSVSSVEVVQDTKDAVALGELLVVEVVSLGWGEARQVVTAVVVDGAQNDQREPEPAGS